jgi:hypothetical protein
VAVKSTLLGHHVNSRDTDLINRGELCGPNPSLVTSKRPDELARVGVPQLGQPVLPCSDNQLVVWRHVQAVHILVVSLARVC